MSVEEKSVDNNRRDWAVFVLVIAVFQFLADAAIVLDISVARQVLGFIYLTIVPGIVLIKIFDTRSLDFTEKILFSIGLSIAFVIFLGLIVNQIGLSFKLPEVLSTTFFLLTTNFAVLLLCAVCYFLKRDMQWNQKKPNFSLPWILTICLPLLSVLGTTLVNFNGNSVILLFMIGIAALVVLLNSVWAKTNWPFVLFMITLAVLLQTSLISNYIVGFDVHVGYHVFKITQNNGIWNSIINETAPIVSRTNQMLSVTIFPTIYSNILNLDGTWIFKIVYPLIFALVPVGLFRLYQKYEEKKTIFIAMILILANITFVAELPGLPTQMIGEFFLVLTFLVIFHRKIDLAKKTIFFTVFSLGIIVSHYGISYVFMLLIFITWFFLFLRKKQSKIKSAYVILFFVLAFSWYIYTSQSASFTSLLEMSEHIYTSFWKDLFTVQSRPEKALTAIGVGEPAASIGHWLGRGLHYAVQFFIVLGIARVILKQKKYHKFDREYTVMSLFMLIFAVSPLAVPSFNLLNMTRMYHVSLLFLAPFCIIGGKWFFSLLPPLRTRLPTKNYLPFILISIAVTSLFLFETGFIYEVTGDVSYSVPLSMYRMDRVTVYGYEYISESVDVFGAKWLHSNIAFDENTRIYGDQISVIKSPLTSYAFLPLDQMKVLSNVTSFNVPCTRAHACAYDYVYLRNFNTFDGKIFGEAEMLWNISQINPLLEDLDKIYTNGGSEVYIGPYKTSP